MWNPFGGGASRGRLSLGMEDEGALTVTVTVAVLAVTAAWLAWRRLRRGRLPPGPRAWPIVGNLMQMQSLAQGVRCRGFWEWSQVYGPIMSVWMGNSLNVVVSSPELAKQVLKEHDQPLANRHRNRPTLRFSRNGQDLIWADYGPHYVKVRKVCTLELFTPKRLEALRPLREDEVSAMLQSLSRDVSREPGVPVLVRKYLSAVTFNNITRIVFGKRFMDEEGNIDPQGLEFKEIVSNGVKLGATANMAEHISYLRWMFPLQEEVFVKHNQRRDRLTKTIMEEYRAAHQNNKQQHFVDALLTLQHQYSLSDDTVFGLLWDMITAGMDTTAITAEWAMAELVRNPEVQARAQEELDRVVGRDRNLTEADFGQLPYLSCIVKEALRLHPPTPLMLPHKAAQAVRLGGYHVPRGANVHVNVWAIGRDPGVWRDPLAFRPERFLEEDVDMKGHDFRLLPFGAGRRICPGAQLGIFLLQSMVGHLLHAFQWAPPPGSSDVDLAEAPGLVTFMATPVLAVASPRLPHQHLYQRLPTATM